MRITTRHPLSIHGMPVILGDDGKMMEYGPGLTAVLARLGWTRDDLAARTGYTRRSVESWWSTRRIPAAALNVLADALSQAEGG